MSEHTQKENEKKLMELLVSKELITDDMAQKALAETKRTDLTFVHALDRLGFISEEKVAQIEAEALDLPYINLKHFEIDQDLTNLISLKMCEAHKVFPLCRIQDTIMLAMVNPQDILGMDKIRQLHPSYLFEPVLVSETSLTLLFESFQDRGGQSIQDLINNFDEQAFAYNQEKLKDLLEIAGDPPLVKLVNQVILQAVKNDVSDIHVEPCKENFRIRFRIDGVLHEVAIVPKSLQNAFVSRIKILSTMDITEIRKPQDGRIKIEDHGKFYDLRVSTFPTLYGENVVLRILNKGPVMLGLKHLGFVGENLNKLRSLIRKPYGIILVTGPTGSGKTSTLYGALSDINSMEKNIITIEDPIEYELPIIRQTQVNPKAGLTFASGLRSILRQDPDVIMVGEIRDQETAEIAVHAALTGHLVLATLHTNDAASAVTRLIDMGIEPFLVSSSLVGVIAQRLVRKICSHCKQSANIEPEVLARLGISEGKKTFEGRGCEMCKQTGYSGRIALFEILTINEELRKLIIKKATAEQIMNKAVQESHLKTLRERAVECVENGSTTFDEILMVIQHES